MADIYVNNAPFINKWFYVSGAFGEQRTDHVHTGLDLAPAGYSGSLYAIDDFTVIDYGYDAGSGYGNYFVAKNSNNVMYLYAHLSGLPPQTGTHFNLYDYVGEAGRSGTATGVHLHLAMQQGNTWNYSSNLSDYINPTTYLNGINNVATYSTRYYFNGTPGPGPTPTPGGKKSKFPWYIYQNTPGL